MQSHTHTKLGCFITSLHLAYSERWIKSSVFVSHQASPHDPPMASSQTWRPEATSVLPSRLSSVSLMTTWPHAKELGGTAAQAYFRPCLCVGLSAHSVPQNLSKWLDTLWHLQQSHFVQPNCPKLKHSQLMMTSQLKHSLKTVETGFGWSYSL